MYYPIIDKLKQVMEEIGQGGGGTSAFIVHGTLSDPSTGTGVITENFSDIVTAYNNNQICLFTLNFDDMTVKVPLTCLLVGEDYGSFTALFTVETTKMLLVDSDGTFRLR